MSILILVLLFILGAVFGSFINVLIDRIPRGESILGGRSYCEKCKKQIKPYDMIPVLSYLLLSGKCRNCKSKIPKRILIVEFLSGLFFVLLFASGAVTTPLLFVFLCAISLMLLAIAIIDIEHGIISDALLMALGFFSVLYIFFLNPLLFTGHLITALVAFSFLFIIFAITRGKGIGFGDVKFAFFMGFLLGPLLTIVAFYTAFLTGALISIILVLGRKKKFKKSTIPFGPFLSLGVFVSIVFGNEILSYVRPYLGF